MGKSARMRGVGEMAGLALAVAGAGLSIYLTVAALSQSGGLGCGDAGCGSVLQSTWGRVVGLPVAAVAGVLYLVMLGALLAPWRREGQRQALLAVGSGLLIGAAAWFVFVQAAILHGWCPWCLGTHAIGVALGALLLVRLPSRRSLALLAAPMIVALAVVQATWPTSTHPVLRRAVASGQHSADPSTDNGLVLLDGRLQVRFGEAPTLGKPGAAHLGALLFDYACPHCRRHHGALKAYLEAAPDRFALIAMPVPLNSACNDQWPADRDMARFTHSCELARLSLIVWKAAPDAWPAFDAWMWSGDDSPGRDVARTEARKHLGELDLAMAESRWGDWADQQIQRNVQAWADVERVSLPVTLVPGLEPVSGAFDQADGFAELVARLEPMAATGP